METSGAAEPTTVFQELARKYQYVLDKASPHTLYRWIFFVVLFSIYFTRVFLLNGWFIVTYALGIYLLNQLIGFLSPQFDPEESKLDGGLPTRDNEEFRPFARRVPEFKFWHSCCRAVFFSFIATFFSVFDVPVFWPVLLLYFVVLFVLTMKRQIKHMLKHKYVPFSFGKAVYTGTGKNSK